MSGTHHSRILLFCIAGFLLAFFLSMRIFDGSKTWKHIVTSDGRGYYAYLPALLIDQDPTFSLVVEREKKLLGYPHYKPGYIVNYDGKRLNKYFSGEAVLLLPFFLLGMFFTWITGHSMDGYSFFFQIFTGIGSLFYLIMGLNFLLKILERLEIRKIIISLVIILVFYGTNLFYYTLWQPTMSHVFSFFVINGFLWYSMLLTREWSATRAAWMAAFFALVCLVRPTNVLVVLLIPFAAGNLNTFRTFLNNLFLNKKTTLLCLLLLLAILSIQPLLWYIQTGKFFIWSYRDEGFRFSSPEIMNVLFSYRKGLFVYTPLILVACFGIIPLLLKNRWQFFSMLIFLLASTYVISCWWSWYYGDGFGLRAFIDYFGIFAILLALLISTIPKRAAVAVALILLSPMVFANLFQTWQYSNRIIQANSMSKEKYCHIFMRSDSLVFNSLGGRQEIPDYRIDPQQPFAVFSNDFETEFVPYWNNNTVIGTVRAFSGLHTGYLDSLHQYSPGLFLFTDSLDITGKPVWLKGEVMVWDSLKSASNDVLLVLSMEKIRPGENYWDGFLLNDIPSDTMKIWRKCSFSLMLPEIKNTKGILKIYIWNTGKKPVLIDDFRIRLYGDGGLKTED